MFRQILAFVDIISGIFLILTLGFPLVRLLALFCIGKGIWSIISSVAMGYFTDWMGGIDTIAGICLNLVYNGSSSGLFSIVGIVMIVKGLYSLV